MGNQFKMVGKQLLGFLVVIFASDYVIGTCDVGWAEFKEDCVFFMNRRDSWVNAEDHCRKMGAWLVSDDSAEKHNFLTTILNVLRDIRIYPHFLGASDFAFEQNYRWIETGDSVVYTRWGANQPNGSMAQNCLAVQWGGDDLVWVDEDCNHGLYYMCEKPNNASAGIIGRRHSRH